MIFYQVPFFWKGWGGALICGHPTELRMNPIDSLLEYKRPSIASQKATFYTVKGGLLRMR